MYLLAMLKYFVIRTFRVTSSSVDILKGCMVKEMLGTPVLEDACTLQDKLATEPRKVVICIQRYRWRHNAWEWVDQL